MLPTLVLALLSGLSPVAASTSAAPDDEFWAYAYTPAGAIARVELPGDSVDVRESAYDAFGRPSEELRERNAAVVRRTTTVWSGLGATRTVHDVVGGDALLRTVLEGGGPAEVEPGASSGDEVEAGNPAIEQVERFRHEYDAAGRLDAMRRDVWAADAWVEDSPGLDADDNPLPRLDVAFDPLGRMRAWVEDGQTRTFTWDAESRMVQATLGAGAPGGGETWNYAYNWRDQRTLREGGALGAEWAYAYRWGADGLLTEQVTAPSGAVTDRAFVQGAGLTLGVVSGAGVTAFGHDHLGSPVVTRAPGGAVDTRRFGAWGALASGDAPAHGEVQVGYTGHGFDPESGLVYAQARYYATGLGVFLSEDPYEGSLGEPLSLGRWGYVHGNPVELVDPDGRCSWSWFDRLKRGFSPNEQDVLLCAALVDTPRTHEALKDREEIRGDRWWQVGFSWGGANQSALATAAVDTEFQAAALVHEANPTAANLRAVTSRLGQLELKAQQQGYPKDAAIPMLEGEDEAALREAAASAMKEGRCTVTAYGTPRTCASEDDRSSFEQTVRSSLQRSRTIGGEYLARLAEAEAKTGAGDATVGAMASMGAAFLAGRMPDIGDAGDGGPRATRSALDTDVSYPDPAPLKYNGNKSPDSPVADHIRARSHGGHPTDPANQHTRAWSENSRKGGHEGSYLRQRAELEAQGLTRQQAEHALQDYRRWIETDIHAHPVDPNVLDTLTTHGD